MTPDDQLPMLVRIAETVGISYRQVDYWVRQGWIKPAGPRFPGSGNGRERRIEHGEAFVLERMVRLVRAGLTPDTASAIARRADHGQHYRIGDGIHIVISGPGT